MDRDRRGFVDTALKASDAYDPDVTHLGRGESYRPGGGGGAPPYRPGPARDSRANGNKWISDRRDGDRREDIDSYVPLTSRRAERPWSRSPNGYRRRRSRSPIHRGRDDTYSSRPRSPPRRHSPRRDERARSPPRRRSRSPYGGRPLAPTIKRARDISPPYLRRSPPPAKRERLSSPDHRRYDRPRSPRRTYSPPPRDLGLRGYRIRSRTPPKREERKSVYGDETWRRRSPSPRAALSRPASGATSRRSSPPIHPDRISLTGSRPRSPAYPAARSYDARPPRSPVSRPRSPMRRERSPPRQPSPPRSYVDRTRAPPSPRHDYRRNDQPPAQSQPPSGPSGYRNGSYDRQPPTGPSRGYNSSPQMSPPAGPSSSSVSMSAHNRPNPAMLSAPTRPRGAPPGRFDGPPRDFSAPPPRRGGFGGPSPRPLTHDVRDGPQLGHRGGFGRGGYGRGDSGYGRGDSGYGRGDSGYGRGDSGYGRGESGYGRGDSGYSSHRPNFGREDGPSPFRPHNNSSSTTYPRTQRFNTALQHLAGGEKIIPGGKLAPPGMNPEQEKRIKQLEESAEKIREEIEDKQKSKREALREWDVRQRESEREGLRSELAERHLEKLTEGEDGAGAAF